MTTSLHARGYAVQLTSLGSMLDELQAVFAAKGCRLTEVSVTLYPPQDCEGQAPDDEACHQPVTTTDCTRHAQCL
jgi:hypothetical protein